MFSEKAPLVGILGGGAFGTALAVAFARHDANVRIWMRSHDQAREVNERHRNEKYAKGFDLPHSITATEDLKELSSTAEILVYSCPSSHFTAMLRSVAPILRERRPILVNTAKGLDLENTRLHHEVVAECVGEDYVRERFLCLSGPSFAAEMLKNHPTSVSLAGFNAEASKAVQKLLAGPTFRIYTSPDLIGCQLGGAMKNVIAIAAGMMEGMGFGYNTQAALINRGLGEIRRLGTAMGARTETFLGLAVLGDLILTCTGSLSRNHSFGVLLGKGSSVAEAKLRVGSTIEGIPAAAAVQHLAQSRHIDVAISGEVYKILHEGKSARQALDDLLARPMGEEWD